VVKDVTCDTFRRELFHFQQDELEHGERLRLQEHLDDCSRCARLLEVEATLLAGLKSRLAPTPAPPGLETRIREALRTAAAPRRHGLVAWLRAPWFAAAAASLLLAVLLVPGLGDRAPGIRPPADGAIHVLQEATVVDRDCDRAGYTLDQQRRCGHPEHLNALKLPDGSYWHIDQGSSVAPQLVTDREMRGHRIRVEGDYNPQARTVQLQRVQDLGMDTL
jgi:anti-sigma factor (TIGR02949 family)